ncbi:MAG TPA: lysylphosphatidylglycerol synthase transmembrane domain-containing protein [Capillimicrobium sp.]|nr:lysylphosphatidylglycerol synthase transmembrane domain-containing protein [Capillimicrobium sp.]
MNHGAAGTQWHVPSARSLVLSGVVVLLVGLGLYLLLPRIAGLDDTWDRIDEGQPAWLAAALALELASYASYVLLLRAVIARPPARLGWHECTLITVAGVAASRILAAGGAGGVALTAWACRRAGMPARLVAVRLTAFMVLLYGVFMAALLVGGVGLRTGVLAGAAPGGVTVPAAAFGGTVIVTALLMTAAPREWRPRSRWRPVRWLSAATGAVRDGVREAIALTFRYRDARLLGAVGWWAFDIAVLWACVRAFGGTIETAPLVVSYFVGMLGNLLPVPGGIGGVDGALIGALIAFGVSGGLAIAAVLVYRAFAFWLPTIPGIYAYVRLVREARDWSRAAVRRG